MFNASKLWKSSSISGPSLTVKPGITGLAQIQGRLDLSLQERLYWDLEYVKTRSIFVDVKIIFLTFYYVVTRKGAS